MNLTLKKVKDYIYNLFYTESSEKYDFTLTSLSNSSTINSQEKISEKALENLTLESEATKNVPQKQKVFLSTELSL